MSETSLMQDYYAALERLTAARARIAELEAELKLEQDASRQAMLAATQRLVAAEANRDHQMSWKGAAYEYEEQARFARAQTEIVAAERDRLLGEIAEIKRGKP